MVLSFLLFSITMKLWARTISLYKGELDKIINRTHFSNSQESTHPLQSPVSLTLPSL